MSSITGTKFDHIAVAVKTWDDAWPLFIEALGGSFRSGGQSSGFLPAQLAYENQMRVEILQPYQVELNNFLKRFLDKFGPGPHHMTFKVPDINQALECLRENDISPVSVNIENPWWKEVFLHPKQTYGIVIQLAQAAGSFFVPRPDIIPAPPEGLSSSLIWVAHLVDDLDGAINFFSNVLGATLKGEGKLLNGSYLYVELNYIGPATLRLLTPTQKAHQESKALLEARNGINHHIAFKINDITNFPFKLNQVEDNIFLKEPDKKTGTRVLLITN